MDTFAIMNTEEKLPYFEVTAAKMGLSLGIVEKDFWVCWTLKQLFSLPVYKEHLIFKGGTSLSKVYKLIERFSEDIDISINKSYFGYINENDPETATSKKKQKAVLTTLSQDCQKFVQNEFKNILENAMAAALKDCKEKWSLEIDEHDPAGQSLLFHYPSAKETNSSGYINQFVKIEMGARSDHWPAEEQTIYPFIEEVTPNTLLNSSISIKALSAERTFWEKATILHQFAHFPEDKNVPERQSRHYFDFYRLINSNIKNSAQIDLTLLERVVKHKQIYFTSTWANYESARKGTLKLIPDNRVLKLIENDYEKMAEMFYGKTVRWSEILDGIHQFQCDFNTAA